jgi:outer membrane protein insertion porin family
MSPLAAVLLSAALSPAPLAAAGDKVASVRIAAPAADVERLSRYVEVQVGEPLRPDVVHHVVELFYATGDYEDVIVEAEPGPAGLDVVFRPIPAPLLASVLVEGDRVISAGEVARIARLRPRETLWAARLERAARDVAVALAARGYLEAQVTASVRRVPGGADAAFTVKAGPRARVGTARVVLGDAEHPPPQGASAGLIPARAKDAGGLGPVLRGRIRPSPGDVFRRERAQAAVESMRRKLVGDGYWRAQVDLEESYDPATGRVALLFRAQPGPVTAVEFAGARVGHGLRSSIEDLLRDGGLKADVLEEAMDRLEQGFRLQGYRDVSVVRSHEMNSRSLVERGRLSGPPRTPPRAETRGPREVIVYEVRPGPQARLGVVHVEADVRDVGWPRLESRPGEPLVDSVLAEDARTLARALEDAGHTAARVETVAPEGGGDVPVVFRIQAGPRTVVSSVKVDAPEPRPPDSPARELRVRPGAPYRLRDVARDRDALLTAYRDAGYAQAEVTPETTLSEDRSRANVLLRVRPGPRLSVDHVVVAGLEETAEDVVRREITLHEGGPLGQQQVIESQRRLGALGLFQRVSVAEIDPESPGSRTILVSAEEAPLTTIAYGIGYSENDLLRGSLEVTRRNLFGMDRTLSAFARLSFRGSRFLATFREPYFLGRRQEMFASGFREEGERPFFDFVRYGGTLQTARALSPRWSLIVRAGYQRVHVFNVINPGQVSREFGNYAVAGPSSSVVNDTRDDSLEPHRGHFLTADVEYSDKRLGGDTFVKGFLQASTYERLTSGVVLALNARLGLARTLGLEESIFLPRAERFYAGGDYSLRGFSLDSVLPTGGNALLLGSAELRVDAGRYFSAALFSDVGNVYPLVSDLTLSNLRYTAGIGLRYKSALGPLRVDWGYKLDRRLGESAYHVHLTIGHAF